MSEQSDHREQTRVLEEKAAAIRQDVDLLLREAELRRQQALGLAGRLRDHPFSVLGAAFVLGAAGVGLALLIAQRHRQKRALGARLAGYGAAFGRLARRSGLSRARATASAAVPPEAARWLRRV